MRHFLWISVFLAASPALGDVIELVSVPVAATIYPQGATVTREVSADLPAGTHQIVIPGLNAISDPASLRLSAEGVTLGAYTLRDARAQPEDIPDTPALIAARDEVFRLERALRARDAEAEAIRAEIAAADDMLTFLRWLAGSQNATTGDVAALIDLVDERFLRARLAMVDAETRAQAARQGHEQDARKLALARQRLAPLEYPDQPPRSLVVTVESTGGPARIALGFMTHAASWHPVYEFRLAEQSRLLEIERGVMVGQATGEDWQGVSLTLSTARPSAQSAPSDYYPHILHLYDPRKYGGAAVEEMEYPAGMAPAVVGIAPSPSLPAQAMAHYQGSTLVHHYGSPVDLRSGADALRLSLGTAALPVDELLAEAVPALDRSAYLVADSRNTLDEVLLPGQATMFADGAMVGIGDLPLTPAGEDLKLGFGAIDGIMLERRIPDRAEGDRGMIRRETTREETAILSARNLTGRDYTLRLIDGVPVSEQTELQVDWTASVPPGKVEPDDQRGLLVWEMPLPAGETQEITLHTTIRWPEGKQID
ncbi:MAG: DUF4139 domain-containing protein [Paracoccus sp. (in: a-proteobacteria)]|nr:DUF4139 domain-containing protein [Paracoccus sp. (in: a-proteobacteria)]